MLMWRSVFQYRGHGQRLSLFDWRNTPACQCGNGLDNESHHGSVLMISSPGAGAFHPVKHSTKRRWSMAGDARTTWGKLMLSCGALNGLNILCPLIAPSGINNGKLQAGYGECCAPQVIYKWWNITLTEDVETDKGV